MTNRLTLAYGFRRATACALALLTLAAPATLAGEHSVARQWNEALLHAIRHDFARPTVHARNLCHVSSAVYDAWAVYDEDASTFLLGRIVDGYAAPFTDVEPPTDVQAAQQEAISYAAYRMLSSRFAHSPNQEETQAYFDSLMTALGYDTAFTSTDYSTGSPAALGNYIAEQMLFFGVHDRSNEQGSYQSHHYEPINPPLLPTLPGNPDIVDLNRWQPLGFDIYIDQSGNEIPGAVPPFLGPEWGVVSPFSLSTAERTIHERGGYYYWVYHDPGPPPYIDTETVGGLSEEYKWGHGLVAVWSGHLDPSDGVMWDISPGSIGNIGPLPETIEEYRDFYDLLDGGDTSFGWDVNPYTGEPYEPQMVPRGDYARVLAEFWADGPASETPPGHWFVILNYVNDHPLLEKRFKGEGPILSDLEWDVKAYFTLGGTMHDVAVTAWGIKGWYDYVRPISAIRAMADLGQSSDPSADNFHPGGIHLVPGYVETVEPGDPITGGDPSLVGKIKLYAWRGHDYVTDPETQAAGVGWILAENWWPYQRPTFVTPPFAGYISGHSTFSRAAAIVMGLFTGDEYFPGGIGEFPCPQNEFLVFEDGPSVDLTLQWATYTDASDQTSLSRIWGGIHPPADDIPGRRIGEEIGAEAFAHAERFFDGAVTAPSTPPRARIYPNPVGPSGVVIVQINQPVEEVTLRLVDVQGRLVYSDTQALGGGRSIGVPVDAAAAGVYFLSIETEDWESKHRLVVVR